MCDILGGDKAYTLDLSLLLGLNTLRNEIKFSFLASWWIGLSTKLNKNLSADKNQVFPWLNIIYFLILIFHVSGLRISASKIKAVWFGKKYDTDKILCPDLGLKWVKQFSLLEIEFDNNLENMKAY